MEFSSDSGKNIVDLRNQGDEWLTDEIRALLSKITGRHAPKKRRTVIKLAFALERGVPVKQVFAQEDTCSEQIWYCQWRKDPVIRAAYEAVLWRAAEWVDAELVAEEAARR